MTTRTSFGALCKNEAPVRASRLDRRVERNHAAAFEHGHDSGDSAYIFALSTHFIFWSFFPVRNA
jgi:hypothetical protein